MVGLAAGRALAQTGRDVLVIERANAIGTGTSSRNSEIVHAGTLCVRSWRCPCSHKQGLMAAVFLGAFASRPSFTVFVQCSCIRVLGQYHLHPCALRLQHYPSLQHYIAQVTCSESVLCRLCTLSWQLWLYALCRQKFSFPFFERLV